MFVCQCAVVSDREVAAAIDAGADTVEEVGYVTGAGTGCGTCVHSIEAMISERCGSCPLASLAVA